MSQRRKLRLRDPLVTVSLISFVAYFVIARALLDLFPFSIFPMYAGSLPVAPDGVVLGCQVLAKEGDGLAIDVHEYRQWNCPQWEEAMAASLDSTGCARHDNVEDPIIEHLRRSAGTAANAVPVTLVRRVWAFRDGAPAKVADTVIASCQAVRR